MYHYIITSLPMLSYDMEKPPTETEFFDCCGSVLSEGNYGIVRSARLVPLEEKSANKIVEKWNSWERGLRNELVRMRASKKGQDSEKYIAGGDVEIGVSEAAREAFQSSSPLDAESVLNKARWDYLEDLEAGHYFNLSELIVYYLKLQILQRRLEIDKEKGKTAFDDIYAVVLDKGNEQKSG
jgi:hypothetical protein